jgi:GNAT superfamily N-acetyltransferase
VHVQPLPGLAQLPYAEVWFHQVDDAAWRAASDAARALGKTGLEVWTTTRTPEVAAFFEERGYAEVRRYVISELDVTALPQVEPPAFPLVTLAARPDLELPLFELARVAYADQPGRAETTFALDSWREWGLRAAPPEAFWIALDGERVLGYGYLELKDGVWWNGFLAIARDARGRGIAGAIKRAELAWARARGIARLRTATEVRLAPMRALNARLGYQPLYEEIVLRGPRASGRARPPRIVT